MITAIIASFALKPRHRLIIHALFQCYFSRSLSLFFLSPFPITSLVYYPIQRCAHCCIHYQVPLSHPLSTSQLCYN